MTTDPSANGATTWPAYEVLTAPLGSVSQSRADLLGACQDATEQASRALLVIWLKKACSEESLTEARLQALSGNPISGQQLLEDIFDELVDDHDTLVPTTGAPEKVQDLARELSAAERSRLQELSELIYDQLSRVSPRRPGMPDCAPMLRLDRRCVAATTWLMATSGPRPVPSAQELCHALMWNVEEDRDVQALGDIDFTQAPRPAAAPEVSERRKSSGYTEPLDRTPQTLARFFNLHVGLDHAGTSWVILGNWAAGESALEKAVNDPRLQSRACDCTPPQLPGCPDL